MKRTKDIIVEEENIVTDRMIKDIKISLEKERGCRIRRTLASS